MNFYKGDIVIDYQQNKKNLGLAHEYTVFIHNCVIHFLVNKFAILVTFLGQNVYHDLTVSHVHITTSLSCLAKHVLIYMWHGQFFTPKGYQF